MQRGKKPRHDPPEIAIEREKSILQWRMEQRASYPKIAQLFEEKYQDTISGAQISRILKKHRESYLQDSFELVEQEFIEQNELINETISAALLGWADSRKDKHKKTKTVENGTDPKSGNDYEKTIEALETEPQAGDPRFLKILLDASQRKAKLWGLDSAPKPRLRMRMEMRETIRQRGIATKICSDKQRGSMGAGAIPPMRRAISNAQDKARPLSAVQLGQALCQAIRGY
jgi:hypothetical protein